MGETHANTDVHDQRDAEGHPRFIRPADNENLQTWAQEFAPGKLYTMGNLTGLQP